jgi:hypothetical protein
MILQENLKPSTYRFTCKVCGKSWEKPFSTEEVALSYLHSLTTCFVGSHTAAPDMSVYTTMAKLTTNKTVPT